MPANGKSITVSDDLHLRLKRAALGAGKKLGEFVEDLLADALAAFRKAGK